MKRSRCNYFNVSECYWSKVHKRSNQKFLSNLCELTLHELAYLLVFCEDLKQSP